MPNITEGHNPALESSDTPISSIECKVEQDDSQMMDIVDCSTPEQAIQVNNLPEAAVNEIEQSITVEEESVTPHHLNKIANHVHDLMNGQIELLNLLRPHFPVMAQGRPALYDSKMIIESTPGAASLNSINSNITEVDSHVLQLDARVAMLEQRIFARRDKAQVSKLQGQLKSLHQEKEDAQQRVDNVLQHYEAVVHNRDCMKQERDQALQELKSMSEGASDGPLADSNKTTDSAVLTLWQQIGYDIRSLAFALSKNPPSCRLDDLVHGRLRQICCNYKATFGDEECRELLLHAYFWDFLMSQIFNGEGHIWGGKAGVYMKSLKANMIDQAEEENDPQILQGVKKCLAQSSVYVNHFWGINQVALDHLVNSEAARLRPFYSTVLSLRSKQEVQTRDALKAFINKALELDNMIMSSKAGFDILFRDDTQAGNYFNEEIMDAEGHVNPLSSRSIVKYFIAPVLVKIGNADGQNHDNRMILAKARVMCD